MTPTMGKPRGLTSLLPSSMRYGHFRYYWLAMLAGVTGHQMLLNFTMGWLMFRITWPSSASPSPCRPSA
ncbi:MAG: hypothetical protein ACE5Q6_10060 [Dehalococcoidia bacterium]